MENKRFSITLSDGTKLENLELNGNNFVTDEEFTSEDFDGKLRHVVISCDNDENYFDMFGLVGEHDNMVFVQSGDFLDGKKFFILRDMTLGERLDLKFSAKTDYLEMMMEA